MKNKLSELFGSYEEMPSLSGKDNQIIQDYVDSISEGDSVTLSDVNSYFHNKNRAFIIRVLHALAKANKLSMSINKNIRIKDKGVDMLSNDLSNIASQADFNLNEKLDIYEVDDCGCNGPKLILKEGHEDTPLSEGILYHVKEGRQLIHNIYRPLSKNYFALVREARDLYNKGILSVTEDDAELLESNLGEFDYYNGVKVPLDYIFEIEELENMINEAAKAKKKLPPIGKPKRGGSKKFYVYVRKPGGGVKKVSFGMAGGGLRAKLNNPKARRAFAQRHKCSQAKDRTTARYWSCRLPRYAKLLGFKTSFSGYW